jgi:hypothetical protein
MIEKVRSMAIDAGIPAWLKPGLIAAGGRRPQGGRRITIRADKNAGHDPVHGFIARFTPSDAPPPTITL